VGHIRAQQRLLGQQVLEKPVFRHNAGTMIFLLEPASSSTSPDQGVVNLTTT